MPWFVDFGGVTKKGSKRFLALKDLKYLCRPKKEGRLGFRYFKDINSTLLANLGWKLSQGDESLWCRIIRAKYMKEKSFFEICNIKSSSPSWQGICSSRQFLHSGACYKIGNSLKANSWKDPWILDLLGRIVSVKEGVDAGMWTKVTDLCKDDGFGWDTRLIREICKEESAKAIINMDWPVVMHEDRLYWSGNNSKIFTIRNCFAVNYHSGGLSSSLWSAIWNSLLHERKKVFLWRVLANVLPTKEN